MAVCFSKTMQGGSSCGKGRAFIVGSEPTQRSRGSQGECLGRRVKSGTISLLGVTGDGGERTTRTEILYCQTSAILSSSSASRSKPHRTPASLVSPSMHQPENVQIQTPSSLNHSTTSRRSLMVSPRLCFAVRVWRLILQIQTQFSLSPWAFLFTSMTPTLEGIRSFDYQERRVSFIEIGRETTASLVFVSS